MLGPLLAASIGMSILPPAEFDHEPVPPPKVYRLSPRVINKACGQPLTVQALGCAAVDRTPCVIFMIETMPARGALYRHERAHCSGWRH